MKTLDRIQSHQVLSQLFATFGYDLGYIDTYLDAAPVREVRVDTDPAAMPILWYPQSKTMQHVWQIYPDLLEFDHSAETGPHLSLVKKKLLPVLLKALESEATNIYGAGNWRIDAGLGHRVIQLQANELVKAIDFAGGLNAYFFPIDLSWLLIQTHEDFALVAGEKDFIAKLRSLLPDWQKYQLKHPFLGRPIPEH